MQLSQTKPTRLKKKKTLTSEEILRHAELQLESAKFELARINELLQRKSFAKQIQKDIDKLARAARRQRRAETTVDECEDLIINLKKQIADKTTSNSVK